MEKKKVRLKILEARASSPELWSDQKKAVTINKEVSEIKEDIEKINSLKKEVGDLEEISEMDDESLAGEIGEKLRGIEKRIGKEETKAYLSGKYDKRSALIQISSGAGGQDAQDWAAMLLRMYQKYLDSAGFKTLIAEQSFGEAGGPEGRIGIKEVSLEVKGHYAFGLLKGEKGVHRLVRISPFSSKQTRHTSFAMVDVFPEMGTEDGEIEIKDDEIRIDTYRASGPGGQHVNKRESAVRVTHIPTGITASSQSGRLQGKNKEKALKILMAKLHGLEEERKKKEIKVIKGENISPQWGNQARSYILHPYKLVKDYRTGVETAKAEEVLQGNLEEFIMTVARKS